MTRPFKPLKDYGYSPQISMDASRLLRRLAWYHKKPMSKTIEELIFKATMAVASEDICAACKGTAEQCEECLIIEGPHTILQNSLRLLLELHELETQEKMEEAAAVRKQIPLPAYMAKWTKDHFGAEAVLNSGWSLAEAEATYGADWLAR